MRLLRKANKLFLFVCSIAAAVLYSPAIIAGPCDRIGSERKVSVLDYHAVGDGITDDGSAIRAALKAVIDGSKPAALEFEQGKTYRIASFDNSYALSVFNAHDVKIRGHGAELKIQPPNKALRIEASSDVSVCGLTIDYSPLPFTQGVIVSTNPKSGTFDVEIDDGFDIPEVDSNSVHDNREAWRFAIPYRNTRQYEKRVNIKTVHAAPGDRRIRVTPTDDSPIRIDNLLPEETHIVMAMPGRGQKGNFAFRIVSNERVHIEGIKVYAVPEFTFYVADNSGAIKFVDVEERPRPETTRAMAGWRDVFHVKDNRTPIQWDGCYIEGAFDDAFNLSAMYQNIVEKSGPNKWRLRDLGKDGAPIYKPGDRLQVIDIFPERKLIGETTIESVSQSGTDSFVTVTDILPVNVGKESCNEGTQICGSRVVNLDAANEGSLIRNCTIYGSIRLRSKTTLDRSKLEGFLQITSIPGKEGPLPRNIVIKDSELRGNIKIGPDINVKQSWDKGEIWANDIVFKNNRIESVFRAEGASFGLVRSKILWPKERGFELKNCGKIYVESVTINGLEIVNWPDTLNTFDVLLGEIDSRR